MSFVVHVPFPFECSFVEREEVRFDCFLMLLVSFFFLQGCYACKWLQFPSWQELNLQLQFYLAYTKKHYRANYGRKGWRRKIEKMKNKRIIVCELKMYDNLVRIQTPRQRRQTHVNGLASAPNVQVLKFRSPSVEFHKDFVLYFYCIFFNS